MKHWLALCLLTLTAPAAVAQQSAPLPPPSAPPAPQVQQQQTPPPRPAPPPQAAAPTIQNPPEIAFDSVPDFFKLPVNVYFGEGSAVTVDSKGHIFVFSRGGTSTGPAFAETAAQILEFGADGKFIREIGKNLYAWSFAHGIKADRRDNIWAVDKGSNMVVKFRPNGLVDMVFGRKMEASDEDTGPLKHPNPPLPAVDNQFRQPTDVAFDSKDNAYISDGYINSRVAKIDKDGFWVKSWGDRGAGPGQFSTAHGIAVDAQDNVYVADRSNRRIQVFDSNGTFLRQMTIDVPVPPDAYEIIGNKPADSMAPNTPPLLKPGAPWVVCISPPPHQYLFTADAFPGRVYKMTLDGKIVGMLGKAGKQLKQFGWIHGMACPNENTLFVAEVLNWRVQKLILHPGKQASADPAPGGLAFDEASIAEEQAEGNLAALDDSTRRDYLRAAALQLKQQAAVTEATR
ncbi:MAG TPA: peptidyl-alpha-hydroxyglycine alpha-amidating lyase family protein [Stellaceae bacterium]|nr:peptidyl-alpha-hydroxyglycine alpha-amidating lyase family protein [Stellaceae bacterium]